MTIGLTGGIGCGKSTLGRLLAGYGWHRIDTDQLAREIISEPGEVAAVAARFGAQLIADGRIDREKLARIVFADPGALRWLEERIHPQVRSRWQEYLAAHPGWPIVVEIPLLFEKDLAGHFDYSVCVRAPRDVQFARLEQRGLSREAAEARMDRQLPLDLKAARADFVVSNSGNLEFLGKQVLSLLGHLQYPTGHPPLQTV